MEIRVKKTNFYILFITLIFYFFFFTIKPFYNLFNGYTIIINLFSLTLLLIFNWKNVVNKRNVIVFIIQLLLLLFSFITNKTGIGSILQMISLTMILLFIPAIDFKFNYSKTLKIFFGLFFFTFLVINKNFLNPNYVGYIFLNLFIISVILYNLDRKDKTLLFALVTLIFILIISIFRCRTAMVSCASFWILMQIPFEKYNKAVTKRILPYILVFCSLLFTIIYVLLWKSNFNIDIWFFAQKSFFSGRNRIWYEALRLIIKNPLFGVGSKYNLSSIEAFALHNSTFMITLLFGIPNLLLYFINVKFCLKNIFSSLKNNYANKIAIVAFIVLFIADFFESYLFWSNYNFIFFFIFLLIMNRNKNMGFSDCKETKVYIFEEGIDRMGGVERIISTLANNLVNKYDVFVISFYKTRENTFFEYNENVNIKYICNNYNQKSQKMKNGTLLYYIVRISEKIRDYIVVNPGVAAVTSCITSSDIIILGRTDVALKVMPFIYDYKKLIIRDAIHLPYYKKRKQRKIINCLNNKKCTLVVSSSESKKIYEKYLNKNVNLVKIYNPLGIVPNKHYDFDNKTIISVGRYSIQKGFETLIKSFKMVNEKYPDWNLKIVGTNSKDLQFLVEKLQINNVTFIDKSTNIVSELNNSSIYVMASRYEGYANSLVEALACGIPSITFDWLLGADDIVENGNDGIIVKLKDRYAYAHYIDSIEDEKSLSKAIICLIKNRELCYKFSNNAYLKMKKTRDTKKIIEEWNDLINE